MNDYIFSVSRRTVLAFLGATTLVTQVVGQPVVARNVCSNGSFERLTRVGERDLPARWTVLDPGKTEFQSISPDAHTGKHAGRIASDTSDLAGMNYVTNVLVKGEISLWYRVIRAVGDGTNVSFSVIPMRLKNGKLDEVIPPGRQTARVVRRPTRAEVNDHRWHRTTIAFDFRRIEAQGIVFAPRINEFAPTPGSGEVLIDDVEIVAAK